MKFKEHHYDLPACWASYLINGDASFFSLNDDEGDSEIDTIDRLLDDVGLGGPVSCSDEPEFRKYHDAHSYGVLAAHCLMFTFLERV
tara:strand:- start:535 stop:795 length:261 start_codon:yes stop_codon:yes gene_type:complete